MPIFHPLLSASQRIGTIPTLMDPPCGRMKKLWLMRLNAPANATSIIISASILVGRNGFRIDWFTFLIPPPVLPGSGSLGRRRLSAVLSARSGFPSSPLTSKKICYLVVFQFSYPPQHLQLALTFPTLSTGTRTASVADMNVLLNVEGDLEAKTYDVDFVSEVRD
jgi:hypothetical protein